MCTAETDQKALFQIVDKLLHSSQETSLPTHDSLKHLCDSFGIFFQDKISKIRIELDRRAALAADSQSCQAVNSITSLASLKPVQPSDIIHIFGKSPNKTCGLDPVPTWIIKKLPGTMAPIIADIINRSIALSAVPASLKEAWVSPILKKTSLDPENFTNFRPISNLPFLAKTLEKVVSSQLHDHVKTYSLHDKFQSEYRPAHSTETAMLRITNDLLLAADDGQVGCLVLLDLSAAFDTIDHRILLQNLSKSAVHWFTSYLEDRYQKVVIGDGTSSNFKLQYEVPQGSVIGPLLCTLYTADLGELIKKHGLSYHVCRRHTIVHFILAHRCENIHAATKTKMRR